MGSTAAPCTATNQRMGLLDRARIWQYIKGTSNISPNRYRMTTRTLRQRRNYIPMVLFYLVVAILAMS